ncbi:MAG: hypothetical protein SGJ27_06585 [Candidatus Melainabacteria bacterium]|nr:hypothetical protein [Candidatus Melainabacteria bacterium]
MMPEEPKVEPATPVLAPEDTFRILIMDTVEYTDLLKAACKDAGHSVIAAQSIGEAMAFLDGKDHADVIVCAVYLQDESVFELLQRVRNEDSHNDSMFMMLALEPGPVGVKLNHNVEIAGRQLGADAFISMPSFDAELLIAEIKKLLPRVPKLERHRIEALDAEAGDKSLPDEHLSR